MKSNKLQRSRSFSEIGSEVPSKNNLQNTGTRGRKRSRSLDNYNGEFTSKQPDSHKSTEKNDYDGKYTTDNIDNEYYCINWAITPINHHLNDSDKNHRAECRSRTAMLFVKRDDTRICIKGRGYITNCSLPYPTPNLDRYRNDASDHKSNEIDVNVDRHNISVHGYQLYPQSGTGSLSELHSTDDRTNTVYFDSAPWSSWITISLRRGHLIRISSCCRNDVRATHLSNDQKRNTKIRKLTLFEHCNFKSDNQKSNLTPIRTFDICNASNSSSMIRPTIIPITWCNAVQSIVHDYTATTAGRDVPVLDVHTPEKIATQPSATYQHLSYFQESVDDEEDDSINQANMDDDESDRIKSPSNQSDDTNENGYQIMICGAKGVGKSTCLRYCINQLLNVSSYVMVLDADVGQPEYTAPGMVQLTLVHHTTPNTVPPHISQLLPIHVDNNYHNGKIWMQSNENKTITAPHSIMNADTYPIVVIARHYFGSITSSSDPISYMQCMESLLSKYKDYCKRNKSNNDVDNIHTDITAGKSTTNNKNRTIIPLVINLDGWTKDLGYEILTTLIQDTFQLRHLLQISGNTTSKVLDLSDVIHKHNTNSHNDNIQLHKCDAYNIRPTTTTSVPTDTTNTSTTAKRRIIGDSELDDDEDDDEDEVNDTVAKEVAETVDNDKNYIPTTSIIPASILRDIRLITYFMQLGNNAAHEKADDSYRALKMQRAGHIWDTIHVSSQGIDDTSYFTVGHTLATARPYVISFDAIHIRFTLSETHNDITSDDHIMDAINGSLVGLCTLPVKEEDINDTPTVLFPCLGLGLVRAMDRKRRLLFLITPLAIEQLRVVNCLTIGSNIHLPVQCYFRGPNAEAFPYLKFSFKDSARVLGSDAMKSRNNINRRGRASGGGG